MTLDKLCDTAGILTLFFFSSLLVIIALQNICQKLWKLDKRHFRWWWQRRTRGFDDRELWSLDHTILEFALPRLQAFAQMPRMGFPPAILEALAQGKSYEEYCALPREEKEEYERAAVAEWQGILDRMVRAVKLALRDNGVKNFTELEAAEFEKGMDLFHKYFFHLWD